MPELFLTEDEIVFMTGASQVARQEAILKKKLIPCDRRSREGRQYLVVCRAAVELHYAADDLQGIDGPNWGALHGSP